MKPLVINPFIKFAFLISQITLILSTHHNAVIIIVIGYSLIYLLFHPIDRKMISSSLRIGFSLALFMLIFSWIKYQNITLAVVNGLALFKLYVAMLMVSIVYKLETSNKELSYVLSIVFSPCSLIGFDQNKLYTLFLIVLNQSFTMFASATRITKYAKFKNQGKTSITTLTRLIIPFINNNLKQNEMLAIALLNSGYDPQVKKVKPYFITDYKIGYSLTLIAIIALQVATII
ncbi:hypothetical protein RZE82_06005 [Mollicutes bacterium LVI A0039]|nr:hypothetical protein RZE82_06005 [Mollicutes bacterium LVI A0039]